MKDRRACSPPSSPPHRRCSTDGRRTAAGFRLRTSLILALIALAATVVAVATTMIEIVPPPDGPVPQYVVNDFGTNTPSPGCWPPAPWCSARSPGASGTAGRRPGRRRRRRRGGVAVAAARHRRVADRQRRGRRWHQPRSPATSATGRWSWPAVWGPRAARLADPIGPGRAGRARSLDRRAGRRLVPHRRRSAADPPGHGRLERQRQLRLARR